MQDSFDVGLAPETRIKSNLGDLTAGDPVNLERSLTPTSRMGGHFVQGHIDGTGVIESFRKDEDALWMTIKAPEDADALHRAEGLYRYRWHIAHGR